MRVSILKEVIEKVILVQIFNINLLLIEALQPLAEVIDLIRSDALSTNDFLVVFLTRLSITTMVSTLSLKHFIEHIASNQCLSTAILFFFFDLGRKFDTFALALLD